MPWKKSDCVGQCTGQANGADLRVHKSEGAFCVKNVSVKSYALARDRCVSHNIYIAPKVATDGSDCS